MSSPIIELIEGEDGQVRWHLKAANGEIIAQGEAHRDVTDASRAVYRVAELLDLAISNGSITVK